MSLILTTLRVPPGASPQRYEAVHDTVSVGRGKECDWVLGDAERILSKTHCLVTRHDGDWFVTDMSGNGTLVDNEPLDPGVPMRVRHGQRLSLGGYEIGIELEAAMAAVTGPVASARPECPLDAMPQEPAPARPPHDVAGPAADDDRGEGTGFAAALALFASGAGLKGLLRSPDGEAFRELGRAFRTAVVEIRHMLDRLATETRARSDQTLRQAATGNPIRTALTDDDAIALLLGTGRAGRAGPSAAMAEVLRELGHHNVAASRAARRAVEEVLAHMTPERILSELPRSAADLLPGHRRSRAFAAYEALHARMVQTLNGGADTVFDRAFSRAREAELARLATDAHRAGTVAPPSR